MSSYISGSRVNRRLVRIPKDQQKLLERSDAWSAGSLINVPPGVLQGLREFHSREQEKSPENQPSSPPSDSRSSPAASQSQTPHSPSPTQDSTHQEEAPRPMSWSSSPPRVARTTRPVKASPVKAPNLPSEPAKKVISIVHEPVAFPSSSLGDEADLEMEVPGAITDVLVTVSQRNQIGSMDPTPPSAQVIPCTSSLPDNTSKPGEQARRRLMKVPKFDDDGGGPRTKGGTSPASSSNQAAAGGASRSGGFRSAASSAIAQSSKSTAEQEKPEASLMEPPAISRVESGESQSSSESSSSRPATLEPAAPQSIVESPDHFTAFSAAYPGYQGDLRTFVRGVMCLQGIGQRRELPSFLFDDFLRVFADDYMDYIANFDEDTQPLTAVQWYNVNVQEPVYTKNLVSKNKVEEILGAYPDEVNEANMSLFVDTDEELEQEMEVEAGEGAGEEATGDEVEAEPVQQTTEAESEEAYRSPLRPVTGKSSSRSRTEPEEEEVSPSYEVPDVTASVVPASNPDEDNMQIDTHSREETESRPQTGRKIGSSQAEPNATVMVAESAVKTRSIVPQSSRPSQSPLESFKRGKEAEHAERQSKRYRKFLQRWPGSTASSSMPR